MIRLKPVLLKQASPAERMAQYYCYSLLKAINYHQNTCIKYCKSHAHIVPEIIVIPNVAITPFRPTLARLTIAFPEYPVVVALDRFVGFGHLQSLFCEQAKGLIRFDANVVAIQLFGGDAGST